LAVKDGPVSGTLPRPGRSTLRSPLQLEARPAPLAKVAVPVNGNGGATEAVAGCAAGSLTTNVDGSPEAVAERVIVIRPRLSLMLA
jgi:hypothetical protein